MSISPTSDTADGTIDVEDEEGFIPAFNQGMHFPDDPFVPQTAVAGGEVTITGTIHFDCVTCLVAFPGRAVVKSPSLDEPKIDDLGGLKNCESAPFSITIPVPDDPGGTMAVTVEAQEDDPADLKGWITTDTFGPIRIDIVSQQQQVTNTAINMLPWAAAGAVGGFAVSELTTVPQTNAIVGGAGLGAATGFAAQQPAFRRIVSGITTTTGNLLRIGAWTAVGAGAGFAVSEVSGVTPEAGTVGGGAVGLGVGFLSGQEFPILEVASVTALLAAGGFLASQTVGVLEE